VNITRRSVSLGARPRGAANVQRRIAVMKNHNDLKR
jgi:hypothetical protein